MYGKLAKALLKKKWCFYCKYKGHHVRDCLEKQKTICELQYDNEENYYLEDMWEEPPPKQLYTILDWWHEYMGHQFTQDFNNVSIYNLHMKHTRWAEIAYNGYTIRNEI